MIKRWLQARKHKKFLQKALDNLDTAETYIKCLRLIQARGYDVEIVVIVDGVACPSSLMTNSRDKAGGAVIDFLLQTACGERLRLSSVFSPDYASIKRSRPELTENGL